MNHIMVDLETQGTRPTSIILSLGAVVFDPESGETGNTFYRNVDVASCEALGLTRDQSTMDWWAQQDANAQQALEDNKKPVTEVIGDFTKWWHANDGGCVWAHGAIFDVAMLENIYRELMLDPPWAFWNVRCCRTILACANRTPERTARDIKHHALHDAIAQAKAVAAAFRTKQFAGQ